jgi:glycosyltransferase involved in cell wall biosynthesis
MLIVTKDFWSDVGVANAAREVARGLVKLGVELVTIIHDDSVTITSDELKPSIAPEAIHGGNTLLMRFPQMANYLLSRRAARMLRSMQKDLGDDYIVHCHNLFPAAFLKGELIEKRARFVTTIHGTIRGELERFCKEKPVHPRELLYRMATYGFNLDLVRPFLKRSKSHFIALSAFDAREIMRQNLPASQIHVIPNGVDLEVFRPYDSCEARKRLELPADKSLVVTVCAIEPRKGLHILVKAADAIIRDFPEAYFVVVGTTRSRNLWYMSYLEKLISKYDLRGHFRFTGFVPKNDLPLYLSAADLFTMASYAEGAPLVIPGAMACGCPVVATESGGAGYLPRHLTVNNGDHNELARKISFYLLNSKERRLIGKEMRKKALNELSWAKIAKRTHDLYEKITR